MVGVPSRPPLVFVADLDAPQLHDDDRHHLQRVLRVRDGDEITLGNGVGAWRAARFGAAIEPIGPTVVAPAPAPAIGIAFAIVKGERPELVTQKLTELGVDRIVPFVAARSVVQWDDAKAARQLERLRRVAREAAMQSRRAWLPEVEPLASFEDVAARPGAAMADRDGGPLSLACPLVLVGPEGGWTDEERGSGLPRVGLATPVLRAETAAIAASCLLGALRAGIVGPPLG